jgi:hypothetical protein
LFQFIHLGSEKISFGLSYSRLEETYGYCLIGCNLLLIVAQDICSQPGW